MLNSSGPIRLKVYGDVIDALDEGFRETYMDHRAGVFHRFSPLIAYQTIPYSGTTPKLIRHGRIVKIW